MRLIGGIRRALGLHHPGRNLAVFPDDTFVISYPKSGNTWTRFLVSNLAYPKTPADFSNINTLIPDPESLSKRELESSPRPRILKSHTYFDPRFPRIIYIVRDPRDVAVSEYHFHRKRRLVPDDFPIAQHVTNFVKGTTTQYASWGENVVSWLMTRGHRPGFLFLRYEDLLADTFSEMKKVAQFLAVPSSDALIRQAIERSSTERMRELEKTQALTWSSIKETRQDIPFVRTARSGNWRTDLPESAIAEIENAWGPLMTWLGYELALPGSPRNDSRHPFSMQEMGVR
jgi:hypothetical protein